MKRKGLIIIISIIISLLMSTNVFAATPSPIFGYKLSGGVGNYGNNNQYYYIDSSANNFYHNSFYLDYRRYITKAMDRWIYTNELTPISFIKTTIQQNSVIDIYVKNEQYSSWAGLTYCIVGSTNINPRTQNWNWNKVTLNAHSLQFDSQISHIQAAAAHEIGHCFGLDENEIPGSVMYKYLSGILDGGPSVEDCRAINRIY
ncbi:matrixin family metalloprotease [Clostridium sp. UBA5119]|uniref:matrixin family metalloprotease n=1 Tax=Clostridium sp. UBA5119 TaxID=1946366 RepID=UPI0032164A7E